MLSTCFAVAKETVVVAVPFYILRRCPPSSWTPLVGRPPTAEPPSCEGHTGVARGLRQHRPAAVGGTQAPARCRHAVEAQASSPAGLIMQCAARFDASVALVAVPSEEQALSVALQGFALVCTRAETRASHQLTNSGFSRHGPITVHSAPRHSASSLIGRPAHPSTRQECSRKVERQDFQPQWTATLLRSFAHLSLSRPEKAGEKPRGFSWSSGTPRSRSPSRPKHTKAACVADLRLLAERAERLRP
eukprot:scaffold3504_cov240-Pinguiococcus_pyrenoidosus.AAC.20